MATLDSANNSNNANDKSTINIRIESVHIWRKWSIINNNSNSYNNIKKIKKFHKEHNQYLNLLSWIESYQGKGYHRLLIKIWIYILILGWRLGKRIIDKGRSGNRGIGMINKRTWRIHNYMNRIVESLSIITNNNNQEQCKIAISTLKVLSTPNQSPFNHSPNSNPAKDYTPKYHKHNTINNNNTNTRWINIYKTYNIKNNGTQTKSHSPTITQTACDHPLLLTMNLQTTINPPQSISIV